MVFDAERRSYAKVPGLHVARSRPGRLGGCVGTRPHRLLPTVPGCASRARGSGVPARGPRTLSPAQERQLLPRRGQADRSEGGALRHRASQPDPERALRPRARFPAPRHAGAHPRLDSRDIQLPSPGRTGARPLCARQQRADPRRRGRLWRDACDRILRFFVNLNPTVERVWISKGTFEELLRRHGEQAGVRKGGLTPGLPERAWSGLLKVSARAFPMARVIDTSPYDRRMRRFHNWMKDTPSFQQPPHQRFSFAPFSAWMVLTDGVSHACISGQHALADTFLIPLRNCRLKAPYDLLTGAA